jgi:4-hydroxy-4-methyl-2-oxoglutarate aldolase
MSVIVNDLPQSNWPDALLKAWRGIPTAIISDELNRAGTMDAGIKCLSSRASFAGPAMTVQTMAADNLAIHRAVSMAMRGAVLVVDAGGYDRNAVWGGILHRAAGIRGVAAVVIDGCVRDVAELRESALPCFARGVVPAGPHKGWGGVIGGPIQAGGCPVLPGDLIVGDEDGVAVVPADLAETLLQRCRERIEAEGVILARIEAGETTVEIFGLDKP